MRQAIFLLCLWSCSLLAGHAQEADEANYDESKIPPYTLPALLKTSDGREITTVQQWEQIRRPELLSAQEADEANYDESKIPPYTLPALLKTSDGREITTVQQWEQIRRPELLSVFTEQVYGKMPADKVDVSYKKLDDNHSAVNGSATRKQIEITFSHNGIERKALLLMYLPNHVKTKVPVFLHFNFQGNQTISSDPDIIPSQHSDRPRGNQASRWPVEKIIDAGYGLATVHYFDFFPDSKDRYAESILALFGHPSEGDIPADGGQAIAAWAWGYATVHYFDFFPDSKDRYAESILALFGHPSEGDIPADGGQAIAAWAWGYSRVMDYLETDWQVDASKIILMGHSRLGKTSLWVGATDPRFAIVISNESGCGGAALSRRQVGETVNRINHAFPHWFCKNFRRYNKKEGELPIDQHELLALIAPRPLYVASAEEDRWSDPKGEFLSTAYAGEVYKLYGMKGLETTTMPTVNRPLYVASAEEDRWSDPKGEFLSTAYAGEVYKLYGMKGLETTTMPTVNMPIMNRVAYHNRTGVHDVTDFDWENYIKFADKWLK